MMRVLISYLFFTSLAFTSLSDAKETLRAPTPTPPTVERAQQELTLPKSTARTSETHQPNGTVHVDVPAYEQRRRRSLLVEASLSSFRPQGQGGVLGSGTFDYNQTQSRPMVGLFLGSRHSLESLFRKPTSWAWGWRMGALYSRHSYEALSNLGTQTNVALDTWLIEGTLDLHYQIRSWSLLAGPALGYANYIQSGESELVNRSRTAPELGTHLGLRWKTPWIGELGTSYMYRKALNSGVILPAHSLLASFTFEI